MKRSYLLLYALVFALLSLGVNVSAQTTNEGTPHSWNLKTVVADAPVATMPTFDLQQALVEDSINNAQKSAPWRFGFNHDVDLGTNNSGQWINLPNGDRIWRIELFSKYAISMNVIFDDITIPTGGSIYLYSPDKQQVIGAYTEANNNAEHMLGTELLNGSRLVVEYYEPAAVSGQGTVHIGTVTHGYKHVKTYVNGLMKALNSSGDCNIDIACPLGFGWEDQSAAVAMIVVGGNGICTGTLVNNTANDGTPYFLTANHCGTTGGATWSFRFNWNSTTPSCATTTPSGNGPTNFQTANGATLRAANSGSDMALWEIDNLPLATAQTWDLYFAGWDRSVTPATQVTGIHHPSGDIKKICREDQTVVADVWNFNGDPNTQVWRVNDWDQGVTEPGSSGSALFNSAGLIVGQLAGGTAACSGTNDNSGYDGYGRFDISWDGANSSVRLRDWLDPSNTTTVQPGWDPNQPTLADDAGINGITVPDGVICGPTFDPEVELRNFGTNALTAVEIIYDVDGAGAQTFNWTGNLASGTSTTVTLPTVTATAGAHTFNASTNLPNGVADSNPGNDDGSSAFVTIANPETIDFTLNLDCWGSEVTWTVEQAGTVYYSGGPYTDATPGGAGQITEQWCLEAGQCYDFIINDAYGDGMYGSQYGSCTVDGDYSIDHSGSQLATVIAANSDWGAQETNNFCVPSAGAIIADFTGTPLTVCEGSTVSFTDASSGGAAVSWAWSFPGGTPTTSTQQNPTVTYNTAGTYDVTLTATDGGGNTDTETKVGYVTVNPAPTLATSTVDVSCNGACDGSATVTATGGTGPYTYMWLPIGMTGSTATNLCAGTYTCDVTDANGCTSQASVTINEPTAIAVTVSVTNVSCNSVCNGTATVTATGGTPPYTYTWSSGGTAGTETGLCAGSYTVTVTDANGCVATGSYTVTEPIALVLTGTATDESSCGSADGSITLAASGGTSPYQYSIDNGVTYQASATFTGLTAGVYNCAVQDANGCSTTFTITIATTGGLNVIASAIDESCPGACDGSAVVTITNGTAPYTYVWSPNVGTAANVSNLCAGTYQVTATDANGCTGTTSVTVNAGAGVVITGSATDASCGNSDGTITLTATGGTGPYQYSVDGGTTYQASNTFNNLPAGTYICYAQDANGCTSNAFTLVVNNQGGPITQVSSTDASCAGVCDGSATVTATGGTAPYTYSWSPGGMTNSTESNLCAGTYQVVVTDANGCSTTETITINEPTAIVITGTATDASCGNADGTITLTASGGSGPYTYSIDGGVTYVSSNTFNNLAAGTYITHAQDVNGCVSNAFTLVINDLGGVTATATGIDVTCGGLCNGSATVAATGGASPYSYLWTPGNLTSATVGNLCAGTYQVVITDANGCSSTETVTINEPTAVALTGTWTDASCGAADGTIDLTATGGNPPYQYSIDNGATFQASPNFTNLADGIYVTQVMDANGCTAIFTIVVGNTGGTTLQTSFSDVSCSGQCDGSATVTATGGTSPHTYLWTPGAMTTSTVNNLCAGTYTCTVTDANGCAVTEVIVITEPTFIVVTGTSTAEVAGNDGAIDISVSGGVGPYTYSWDNGSTDEDPTGLAGGTYVVTVTDANGCTQTFTIIVDSFVGIQELGGVTLNLYPNPTNGIVNLAFGNLNGSELNVQVMDARGRVITTGKMVNANGEQIMTLDISNAAPGLYFLQVSNETGSVTEKLLKQ